MAPTNVRDLAWVCAGARAADFRALRPGRRSTTRPSVDGAGLTISSRLSAHLRRMWVESEVGPAAFSIPGSPCIAPPPACPPPCRSPNLRAAFLCLDDVAVITDPGEIFGRGFRAHSAVAPRRPPSARQAAPPGGGKPYSSPFSTFAPSTDGFAWREDPLGPPELSRLMRSRQLPGRERRCCHELEISLTSLAGHASQLLDAILTGDPPSSDEVHRNAPLIAQLLPEVLVAEDNKVTPLVLATSRARPLDPRRRRTPA